VICGVSDAFSSAASFKNFTLHNKTCNKNKSIPIEVLRTFAKIIMNDLLGEIKKSGSDDRAQQTNNKQTNRFLAKGNEENFVDVERGVSSETSTTSSPTTMELFLKDATLIKGLLADIRKQLVNLHQLHERGKSALKSSEMAQIKDEMNRCSEKAKTLAREAKLRVQNMDEDLKRLLREKKISADGSEKQTRETVSNALKTKLKEQMAEFQVLREKLRTEHKEVIERRFFALTGEQIEEEKLESMIENGADEQMFKQAILDQGRGLILDTVEEIQERHKAVRELERKLLDLHQIFLDMSVLVDAQGEMIDDIQEQVSKSTEYVKQGQVALVSAREYQKNTRKWACVFTILMMIVLLVILLPILKPWK
jgi:syntaxin 1B/2/3